MRLRLMNVPEPFRRKVQEICREKGMGMMYVGRFDGQELYYITYHGLEQTLALMDIIEMVDKFVAECVGVVLTAAIVQQYHSKQNRR